MIKYDYIMVRFGELSTKGKNKKDFINALAFNIKKALKDYENLGFNVRYDHIYIELNGTDYENVMSRLKDISGIHALSLVHKEEKDIDIIKQSALELFLAENKKTFKVRAKRGDKRFPIVSDQINRIVAGHILKNVPNVKVDVHNPEVLLSIEIRDDAAYIFTNTIEGSGGYPLGMGGKTMHMLSGGIDSPVAAYLMMRRGITVECIHFASPPYTQAAVIYKLEDICKRLNRYQTKIRLHIVPFTKIQEAIYDKVPESYCITIMRRMMYRLADKLAKKRNCPIISSGESLGQVASQTVQSINVINEVTNMPIIRPLACTDKLDIIKLSEKINTYEISIRPYEDCCTIFTPKNPKTQPKLEEVKHYESLFDYESLIDEAIKNIEVKFISEETEELI